MKKITKILLPIASAAAIVAPVACLTSCGFMHGNMTADSNTSTGSFNITFTFKEAVPVEKRGCYDFSCVDQVKYDRYGWADDNLTVNVVAHISEDLVVNKKYEYKLVVTYYYRDESFKESWDETYPGKITYIENTLNN